ncbi:MAG: NAD-dependent epimerase/dehydratase family protein [Candidatus Eisenbacteria bacterium]|nr:NAD-dependent epimerase/dehydratase family protein [Candidatus Eisenbacteria bacterium]
MTSDHRPLALVTGAAGFIGSHLTEALLLAGWRVRGADCLTSYYPVAFKKANLTAIGDNDDFEFMEIDLKTADMDFLCQDVSVVFHQAAQPGVRASWGSEFEVYLRENILVTQRLLEHFKEKPLRKFVYASSSSVYGEAVSLPMKETDRPQPYSPYGVSKLAAEHLCRLYTRNYGLPTVSLRYFTVCGPRQRPDMAFHKLVRSMLKGEEFTVYGEGDQTRDFTFVGDAVAANIAAAEVGKPGEVYNIGGGARVTLKEAIALLESAAGMKARVRFEEKQKGDPSHTVADTTRAREDLNYRPMTPLAEALRLEYRWMADLLERRGSLPA